MYQISAFYEVPRSQKIGFGEVVVIRGLVKMGPKYGKMAKNVYFSQVMIYHWSGFRWNGCRHTIIPNIGAFHQLLGSILIYLQ